MKRSERIYMRARNSALWSVFFLTVSVACGVWAVRANLSDHPLAGPLMVLPLVIAALVALFAANSNAHETSRLMALARREEADEWERLRRPRL